VLWLLVFASLRFNSTNAEKPPLKHIAELLKLTKLPITKLATPLQLNDVFTALKWFQNDLAAPV
jgi:hypothetical protein